MTLAIRAALQRADFELNIDIDLPLDGVTSLFGRSDCGKTTLLPHLSIQDNLLYGYQRTPASLRRLHLQEVTDMLGIDDLTGRSIDRLSGGQRQRVSLGRALLTSPQLLLLDEPLAALDTQTKREIMPFLARLATQSGVPMVMVTHAPDEVECLADRVAFMRDGRITSLETLQAALASPCMH